ncbi:MAG: TldD/PmbA family protein [Alphaproteobacteria bacterium]|nr:TldD/PmbA family protein [Alphaproteobacteria bacterium]
MSAQNPSPLQDAAAITLAATQNPRTHSAEIITLKHTALSCKMRNGKREEITAEENYSLQIRILAEVKTSGSTSKTQLAEASGTTSDLSPQTISELVSRIREMAKLAPPDPALGLAEPEQLAKNPPPLNQNDPDTPAPQQLLNQCQEMDEIGRATSGVTASESAEANFSRSHLTHRASNGLDYSSTTTLAAISAAMVAGENADMQVDWESSLARHSKDLEPAADIAAKAAQRAVARLNPEPPKSTTTDAIFEPRVAAGFLSALAGAANGEALTRGTSFLIGREDQKILPAHLSLIDDPLREKGLASKAVDAEGLATKKLTLFANGTFAQPLLDLASARRLKREPSANASGRGSPSPGTSNLHLHGGNIPLETLLQSMGGGTGEGVWITDLFGFGFNPVTGDWSRAAAGFKIRNGQRAEPISGFTLAGNILNFLPTLKAGDDLKFRTATNSPSLLVHNLTLAGAS